MLVDKKLDVTTGSLQHGYDALGTLNNLATRFTEGTLNITVDVALNSDSYRLWVRVQPGQWDENEFPVLVRQQCEDTCGINERAVLASFFVERLQHRKGLFVFQSLLKGGVERIGVPPGWTTGAPRYDDLHRRRQAIQQGADDAVDQRINVTLFLITEIRVEPSRILVRFADTFADNIKLFDVSIGPLHAR